MAYILQSDSKGEDEFSSILDQIKEQDFFPVLLLDAFDKVTRNEHFDPEFFEFLRAHAGLGRFLMSLPLSPLFPKSAIAAWPVRHSSTFFIRTHWRRSRLKKQEH